jgi:hypothetical protein
MAESGEAAAAVGDGFLLEDPARSSSTHTACLRSPRSIPIVMADEDVDEVGFFMAAGFYPSGPVIALLPSHLFLFALGW